MANRARRLARGYARTGLAAMASAGIVLAAAGPIGGSQAQEAPEATTSASPIGHLAKATAQVVKAAPGVGALELALGSGVAVAELKNELAQAQAQALDLGLIGSVLTSDGCSAAALTPDQLPQPTRADNRAGRVRTSSDEVPVAGTSLGGGREIVDVAQGVAHAVATTAAGITDVVTIRVGQADAKTEVVEGGRQAEASVEVSLNLAGAIDLTALSWHALHRTGTNPTADASFDIGTAKLLGVEIPLDSLAQLETVLNETLAATGVSIQFPKVERFLEPTDLVRITPLRITFKDTPLGQALLGPVLNGTREARVQLYEQLAQSICQAAGLVLVGDVVTSIVSGTGFLTVEIGGAEAYSADFVNESPFGELPAPTEPQPIPDSPPLPTTPAFTPSGPLAAPTVPPGQSVTPRPAPRTAIGPLETVCETIHPQGSPGCSEGALAPLGLLGLAATSVVGALDWRHQRKGAGTRGASA